MNPSKKLLKLIISLIVTLIGLTLIAVFSQNKAINTPLSEVPVPTLTQPTLSLENSPESSASAVLGTDQQQFLVTKVVDGDTINIEGGQAVRFLGIDTPETVDPRRPVGCFGVEASNKNKELLTGKKVVLIKDISETDKYNRLLRYIYLPLEDGSLLFVNDYLVREGYATAVTYPPDVKFTSQFQEAQREAKENKRGLWSKC